MSRLITGAEDLAQSVWLDVIGVGCLVIITGVLVAEHFSRRKDRKARRVVPSMHIHNPNPYAFSAAIQAARERLHEAAGEGPR